MIQFVVDGFFDFEIRGIINLILRVIFDRKPRLRLNLHLIFGFTLLGVELLHWIVLLFQPSLVIPEDIGVMQLAEQFHLPHDPIEGLPMRNADLFNRIESPVHSILHL